MILVGNQVSVKVCCPNCGHPYDSPQPANSDFIFINCQNEKCLYRFTPIVIEKKSWVVVSCDTNVRYDYENDEWIRFYPSQFDKDGKQLWPEVNEKSTKR